MVLRVAASFPTVPVEWARARLEGLLPDDALPGALRRLVDVPADLVDGFAG